MTIKILNKKNTYKIFKVFILNILILITLLLAIETICLIGRIILGKNVNGWMYRSLVITEDYSSIYHPCNRMKTHPILSHITDNKNNCKILDGKAHENFTAYNLKKNNSKIVILGGSTASGFYQNFSSGHTIPMILNKKLKNNKLDVISYAHGSYASLNELQTLITEVRRLDTNIKLIISYNGINDLSDRDGSPDEKDYYYPFMSKKLFKMFYNQTWIDSRIKEFEFFPNLQSLIRFLQKKNTMIKKDKRINFPNKNDFYKEVDAIERWSSNIKIMKAISNALEIEYITILQPVMGIKGVQSKLPRDKNSVDYELLADLNKNRSDYIKILNSFYDEAKIICKELSFCYDLSNIAPPNGQNYTDQRHHSKKGNYIIAKEIYQIIKEKIINK